MPCLQYLVQENELLRQELLGVCAGWHLCRPWRPLQCLEEMASALPSPASPACPPALLRAVCGCTRAQPPSARLRPAEGAALGEEGSAALQLLARSQEELKAAQARSLQLENENVQLQARVSGECWGLVRCAWHCSEPRNSRSAWGG